MSKNETAYISILKDEMKGFATLRASQGYGDKNKYILHTLDQYLAACGISRKELLPSAIDGWLAFRCDGLSNKTKNCYIAYYAQFAKYLISLGIAAFIPECHKPAQMYVPHVYSEQELNAIFCVADSMAFGQPKSRVQFPMLLRILYCCGLRLGEALALRVFNVDFQMGVLIVDGKGHRERLVPMDGFLTGILKRYCGALCKNSDSFVFENDNGEARTPNWAQSLFYKLLESAGIERSKPFGSARHDICLHSFRHTFTVESFRKQDIAGIDNYHLHPRLSIYLGHKNLLETQKYLHMTDKNSTDILAATKSDAQTIFPKELYSEVLP